MRTQITYKDNVVRVFQEVYQIPEAYKEFTNNQTIGVDISKAFEDELQVIIEHAKFKRLLPRELLMIPIDFQYVDVVMNRVNLFEKYVLFKVIKQYEKAA